MTITNKSALTRSAAALAVATLALAACGGSDDDSGNSEASDRDAIAAAVVAGFSADEFDAACIDEGVAALSDADAALLAEAIADGGEDDLPEGLSEDADAQIEAIDDCLDFDVIVANALADYSGDDDREVIFADVLAGLDGDEVDAECVSDGVAAFSDADAALLAGAIAAGDDGDMPEGLSDDADAQIEAITECLDFDVIVDRAMANDE